jgi:transketolase
MTTMRQRFYAVAAELLDEDPRAAVVLAEIGAGELRPHPRLFNVGIREQLMVGVAAGLALEGLRPIVHSYAPVPRRAAVRAGQARSRSPGRRRGARQHRRLVRRRAVGRTHQAPGDVALLRALPGWTIHVPGHPTRSSARASRRGRERQRLCTAVRGGQRGAGRRRRPRGRAPGRRRGPLVLAVGPTLDEALAATADLDATVAYCSTVRPSTRRAARAMSRRTDVVLVEPYLAGTSAAEIGAALVDRPHRLLALGVANEELRRYGTGPDHRALHGLDAAGIRASITAFTALSPHPGWGLPLTPCRRRYRPDAHTSASASCRFASSALLPPARV